MAKTWIKAKGAFTKRIGGSVVVGHPKHKNVNGRVAEVEDGAVVDALVEKGLAEKITEAAYRKELEGDARPSAGDVRIRQLAGDQAKVSMKMKTEDLRAEAEKRQIDISGAKDRREIVKLINGGKAEKVNDEGTDNANSKLGGLTSDTTNHPVNSTPQAPDPAAQSGNLVVDSDAAPTGGEDGGGAPADA